MKKLKDIKANDGQFSTILLLVNQFRSAIYTHVHQQDNEDLRAKFYAVESQEPSEREIVDQLVNQKHEIAAKLFDPENLMKPGEEQVRLQREVERECDALGGQIDDRFVGRAESFIPMKVLSKLLNQAMENAISSTRQSSQLQALEDLAKAPGIHAHVMEQHGMKRTAAVLSYKRVMDIG